MHRTLGYFLCGFMILLSGRLPAQAPLFPLPHDEKEAFLMVKEGTLDSAAWQMVKPYYEQPVLVPQGELRLLVDIFPGSFSAIPLSPRELSAYEPWKETDVQRFFRDFPELVNLYPVLSFATTRRTYHARVGTSLQRYKKNDPVFVLTIASPSSATISFEGRGIFDASSARWQRRAAGLRKTPAGAVTLGNFNLNMDKGLFYGYFPSSKSDSDAAHTWQYPESNAWNGLLYESPEGNVASTSVFFHQQKAETAYGTRCGINKMGRFRVFAGASHLAVTGAEPGKDDFSFAHAEVNVSNEQWNAGAIGGCERSNARAIPFILYAKHSVKYSDSAGNAGFEALYAEFPPGCKAVRSALFHECAMKTDKTDSAGVGRSVVKTVCRLPFNAGITSACGASYYHRAGHPAAEAFVSLTGRTWLDYSLRYTFRPVIDNSPQYHCMTVSIGRPAAQRVDCRAYCRYINKAEAYQSVFLRIAASITGLPAMEAEPFVTVYAASDREREISLGLTQTLRLFEKTWAELKVEVPVAKTFQDQWTIDAKAYFFW
jgi:hypothetical protein